MDVETVHLTLLKSLHRGRGMKNGCEAASVSEQINHHEQTFPDYDERLCQ